MIDYLLIIIGILLLILGIVGSFLPVIPGPPSSYIGLLLLHLSRFAAFSPLSLIILALATIVVTVLDYLIPIWGTKKIGGSKYGIRGATIGLVVGLFFGPLGIIIAPFVGAFVGEMIYKNDFSYALKAGLGSLIGFITGIGLKLLMSLIIGVYAFRGLIL